MSAWGKRTLCLISGASQGIGREIAVQFAKNVGPNSTFILTARSKEGLAATAALISEAHPHVTVEVSSYFLLLFYDHTFYSFD